MLRWVLSKCYLTFASECGTVNSGYPILQCPPKQSIYFVAPRYEADQVMRTFVANLLVMKLLIVIRSGHF